MAGTGIDTSGHRRRPLLPRVAMLTVGALVAGVLVATFPAQNAWASPPGASPGRPVPVHPVATRSVRIPAMPASHRAPVSWPAPGSATASPTTKSVQAGSLPVWIGPASSSAPAAGRRAVPARTAGTTPAAAPGPAGVTVSMAAQSTAKALGLHGAVFTVAGRAGTTPGTSIHVSLDYSAFADAYGGGFGSRLRLVALPACALTTPGSPACRVGTPLVSVNDANSRRVGADVTLPAASQSLVLAAAASSQGSGGNFGAEPLSEENQWVTGGSSGAYTYSYPVQVPPVPGGLEPTVSLDYSSQVTDGLTASTNNQASSIGDGWTYEPGFIENDYPACATNALEPDTLDLCATPMEQTITLDGTTTPLVVTSTGAVHPEADGAQQVIALTGGGYEVIEPDGTQYWFGLNKLPGYATGDATTNSVWTVPVWQNTGFTTAVWRYMLDYVVDPKGNALAYFYNTQTNYYAEGNGQAEGTVANGAYTQGGSLAKIEYGLRAGSVYTQPPAAQVTFTTGTAVRQDAPTDLACAKGAACGVNAPTFWTSYALAGITTQALVGGVQQNVDSWSLAQSYPATNDATTSPSLWLSSITRTGADGTTPISLPPVSFAGSPLPNLAATAADRSAGYSLITRYRLTNITNDTGAVTTIAYSAESSACAAGTFPKDYTNTGYCYPDYWWTDPYGLVDREDWYNLYDAASVTDTDTTGGAPPQVISYTYTDPAWHYDNDTTSRSANWTWDQWRGFRGVTVETGTAPDPAAETADTYFQGMSEDESDYRFNGGVINNGQVNLTSTHGNVVEDKDQYAGMTFEQIVYNGAGTGNQVYDTVYSPWTSTATGTDSTLYQASYITGTASETTYDALAGGGSRESTTTYSYNGYGQVLTENQVPDTTDTTQDTCTSDTYTVNTKVWIVDLPGEVKVTGGASCATAVSDTRYTYDGGTLSAGNLTQVNQVNATASGGTATENYTYDQYGRTLTSQDPDGRTTTTAYSPATGAEPTSVQVTNPLGLTTTTTYDPARDLTTGTTDPAGHQTAEAYNALGQVTAKWTAGNPSSGPAVDEYSYDISDTGPSVITEQVEQPGGGYLTSDTIYDSVGRARETQTQTAAGGTDVSDVSYNSEGLQALTSDPYYVSAPPSGVLVAAASGTVPSQTGYVYDGDGRVTRQIAYALGSETWETDTTYGGDYTTVVPPSGGTSQTTLSDGRGLPTAIYQYHAGVPASPTDPAADYDRTSYTYTAAGKLAGITDAAGNAWAYTYDQLGDQLTKADPDAGTTTDTYDNAGQLMSSTDARGKQVSFTYDRDGRKTAQYDTTGGAAESSATQLASWTYDTLAKGEPTSSTSYSGGASYTEQITGYNTDGLPSGTATIIPAAQGALAGTYTQQDTYAPDGQLTSYTDSGAGSLPTETVTTGYDAVGEPVSLTGTDSYVNDLTYTDLGQPLQYQLGTSAEPAYITESYDPQTGRVTRQQTQTGTAQTSVDDLNYTYDHAGNVTSEADAPAGAGSATDVECFQYDYLARLTEAWAQGSTGCATTPSASAEGGAAPYWNAYTYDSIGDLTGVTATSPTGAVTTTANTYPTAGTAQPHGITTAQVTTPTGSTSTGYGYDVAGQLTAVTGATQTQSLTWNDAGQLTQDTVTPAGGGARNTDYVYDANGTLLLAADPGSTTLYLPDEELALNTGTGAVTGTRYYSLGGRVIATRTGAQGVAYLAGDSQGTDSVAIDAGSLAVTRRYYDPYGNPRGPTPASFPSGQKGFVGGAADPNTGLTDLGAREYQPTTSSFISPDPLLDPYNPQHLNAYAYAEGNPTTDSDPGGLCPSQECEGAHDGPPAPKYTGPYGCVGATQAAVNDCVSAARAAQQSNVSRGQGPTPINHPRSLPIGLQNGMIAQGNWETALEILKAYLYPNPGDSPTPSGPVLKGIRNKNFTIVLSDVTISTPDGDVNKVIAFINYKGSMPKYLVKDLTEIGVQIYRATAIENHAEMAARDFRFNKQLQRDTLGGTLKEVNAAVMNNGACSQACAKALTQYIDRAGVVINQGGYGFEGLIRWGQLVYNRANIVELISYYGVSDAFQAIVQTSLDVPLDLPEIDNGEP